jgi:hypothetical protein
MVRNWLEIKQQSFVRNIIHSVSFTDWHKLNLVKPVHGSLVLGSSQFSLLFQLSYEMKLAAKVAKMNTKTIISIGLSKSVTLK